MSPIRSSRDAPPEPPPERGWSDKMMAKFSSASLMAHVMFALSCALVVAGVVAIDFLGMIVGGPLLIAALMLFLGERGPLRILLTATLPVAAVYLLATHVLHAPLP